MTQLLLALTVLLAAQQPVLRPSFEAASIKPNRTADPDSGIRRPVGGRFTAHNVTLEDLILFAHQRQRFEVLGAPDWVTSERFDVTATMGSPVAPATEWTSEQTRLALQRLIEERFRLVARTEKRERPVFALVQSRPGAPAGTALRRSSAECADPCGIRQVAGHLQMNGRPLSLFASVLSQIVQRIVVDETGLPGDWNLDITLSPDGSPSVFTVVQEQLGLKLEPRQAAVDVFVIDRVDRPTPD